MKRIELNLGADKIVVELNGDTENPAGTVTSDLHIASASNTWNAAVDAIESLVLAHACAGVDIQSKAYIEGLKTAIEACSNNIL